MKRSFRQALLIPWIALALLSSSRLQILAQTPLFETEEEKIAAAKAAQEENHRQNEALREIVEAMKQSINPAFHPLIPIYGTYHPLSGNLDYPDLPRPLYYCPLRDLRKFLDHNKIQTSLAVTRQWLSEFHGLVQEASPSDGAPASTGASALVISATSTYSAWVAESRIALANSNADQLLDNLEQRLAMQEAFALDSLDSWIFNASLLDELTPFLAQSLERMTRLQCVRLLGLVERWRTGNDAWRFGMERSFAQDWKSVDETIPNSGEIPDYEALAKAANERIPVERNTEATGEDASTLFAPPADASVDQLIEQAANLPTLLATERRQALREALQEAYDNAPRILENPFAVQPKRAIKPKWLRQSLLGFAVEQLLDDRDGSNKITSLDEFRRNALRLRMLAAHAAIRKFRWENNRLPKALAELKLPQYTTNPFTKKPFDYLITPAITPTGYALTSPEIVVVLAGSFPFHRGQTIDLLTEKIADFFDQMGLPGGINELPSQTPSYDP